MKTSVFFPTAATAGIMCITIITLLIISLISRVQGHEGHDQVSCGVDKTCVAFPSSCLSTAGQVCDMLFTVSTDGAGRFAHMQLVSKADRDPSNTDGIRWFAVGLSEDQRMGDDAVFECLHLKTGGVDLRLSYNAGKSSRVVGDSPQSTDVRTGIKDGLVSCSWKQSLPFRVRGNSYDLSDSKYHVMLARGSFRSASIKSYHSDRSVTPEKMDLSSVSSANSVTGAAAGGSAGQPIILIKAHAILMTVAWVVLASIAIMIARHYKQAFGEEPDCCGVHTWFFWHRALMVLLLLTVSGAGYCSWRFVGGWSGFSLHPVLGVATITGMLLQVLLAMCRCAPHHPARFIFNWMHFTLGNGTHICAMGTLFSAYEATLLPLLFLYLMAAFILFHILIHLIMQIKRDPAVDDSQDLAISDSMQRFHIEVVGRKPGHAFRKTFLAVYVVGVVSIAAALGLVILEKIA